MMDTANLAAAWAWVMGWVWRFFISISVSMGMGVDMRVRLMTRVMMIIIIIGYYVGSSWEYVCYILYSRHPVLFTALYYISFLI